MIPLKVKTEYSFKNSVGRFNEVFEKLKHNPSIAITDRNSTFGHYKWQKICLENGIKPIFGVELGVVINPELKRDQKSKCIDNHMVFLAVNQKGLKEIYELVGEATSNFYYVPRLPAESLLTVSDNVIVFSGINPLWDFIGNIKHFYVELNPALNMRVYKEARKRKCEFISTFDNNYINENDHGFYEIVVGRDANHATYPQWILSQSQWNKSVLAFDKDDIKNALCNNYSIAEFCNAKIPQAVNVKPIVEGTLYEWCISGAKLKGVDLNDPVYKERFERELKIIDQKNFEDYFLLVGDLISWSKKHMAIGPARGSSAGSLVCYLCDITEIDPIPHGLMFERFLAPDRNDPPDIDTDFEDERRELAFRYLEEKYGENCVARVGTVSYFKPKSALDYGGKAFGIPFADINEVKKVIIERDKADSRANFCLKDTLEIMESGQKLLSKYPEIAVSGQMEGHARHHGQHACGILVTEKPITNYCAIDMQTGAVMLDKKDVEALGMLKIDVLGLRTMTIIRETLELRGLDMSWLYDHGNDDRQAIQLLNDKKFSGIFQWEGGTLQKNTSQTTIVEFNDLVSLTALSRPGPMQSGGTDRWIKRKNGDDIIEFENDLIKPITGETLGVLVYQEQILKACREIGLMNWVDTSALRTAMSKSLGKEYFNKFEDKFVVGALTNGIIEQDARDLFQSFCAFGSWAFNKSHSVSYAYISYWTCVLKYHFPLEFFSSTLRHSLDNDQVIRVLREMAMEGYQYCPFDKVKSGITWTVNDGKIYGGLLNIRGIGLKMAYDITDRRKNGQPLTQRQENLLDNPITPFDDIFECDTLWGHVLNDPKKYNIISEISQIKDIDIRSKGTFLILAKISEKKAGDANNPIKIKERGHKVSGPTSYLNLTLEDDTGTIGSQINRFKYSKFGESMANQNNIGKYYLFKGEISNGFIFLHIDRIIKLTENKKYDQNLSQ